MTNFNSTLIGESSHRNEHPRLSRSPRKVRESEEKEKTYGLSSDKPVRIDALGFSIQLRIAWTLTVGLRLGMDSILGHEYTHEARHECVRMKPP